MKVKNYIVYIICALILISCTNYHGDYKFKRSLIHNETSPVVSFKLGNKNANLIIDTGSEISIIDDNFYLSNMNKFTFIENSHKEITTINGTVTSGVIMASALLNDSIPILFYITDIDEIQKNVFIKSVINIQGIIGCDFLYNNEAVINFKDKEFKN